MTYIVLDASLWVSRLVFQDLHHQQVKEFMERNLRDRVMFLSPALLLAEVAGAISRSTQEPQLALDAISILQGFSSLRLVSMDRSLVELASQLAADLGLRGADSFYVALAKRLSIPLATLDMDQWTKAARATQVLFLGETI